MGLYEPLLLPSLNVFAFTSLPSRLAFYSRSRFPLLLSSILASSAGGFAPLSLSLDGGFLCLSLTASLARLYHIAVPAASQSQ